MSTIKRPIELATNATDGNQLLQWQAKNVDADIYIQHLPPMIFLRESTIRNGLDFVVNKGCSSAFAVMKEQLYLWTENGPAYDLNNLPNSFTLPTTIVETMGFYVTTKEHLRHTGLRIDANSAMIKIDKFEAIDIDYPEDLEFARAVAKGLNVDSEYTQGIYTFYRDCRIKLIVLDVDGVMTDGGMYYSEQGDEFKKFNTKDGMAIKRAIKEGYKIAFLSSGQNTNLIHNRAKLLGVEYVYAGYENKKRILHKWLQELNISFEEVAYIGDDINDIDAMVECRLKACPNDAIPKVKNVADIILQNKGGNACVREFIDTYILGEPKLLVVNMV